MKDLGTFFEDYSKLFADEIVRISKPRDRNKGRRSIQDGSGSHF
jgi:hypothetical protein